MAKCQSRDPGIRRDGRSIVWACITIAYKSSDKSYVYSISQNNQNVSLERKESFKDLGVILDEKLTFVRLSSFKKSHY